MDFGIGERRYHVRLYLCGHPEERFYGESTLHKALIFGWLATCFCWVTVATSERTQQLENTRRNLTLVCRAVLTP